MDRFRYTLAVNSLVIFWCEFHIDFCVIPNMRSLSGERVMVIECRMFATARFSVSVSSVSVQSICLRKFIRDSALSFGFSFFLLGRAFLLGFVFVLEYDSHCCQDFWGVGNQNVLFCCSGSFVLSSSVE